MNDFLPIPSRGISAELVEDLGPGAVYCPQLRPEMTLEERRETVRDALKKIAIIGDRINLMAGELLYEAKSQEHWRHWTRTVGGVEEHFGSFDEYAEEELGVKRRKAYYLISIYEKLVIDLNLPVSVLRELEWSKAKEIVRVIDESNADDLLEACRNMSVKDLQAHVKGLLGEAVTEQFVKLSASLTTEQAENVHLALKVASEMTGSHKTGNLLDLICCDFNAGNVSSEPLADLLGKFDLHKQSLERTFGVQIDVVGINEDANPALAKMAKGDDE